MTKIYKCPLGAAALLTVLALMLCLLSPGVWASNDASDDGVNAANSALSGYEIAIYINGGSWYVNAGGDVGSTAWYASAVQYVSDHHDPLRGLTPGP